MTIAQYNIYYFLNLSSPSPFQKFLSCFLYFPYLFVKNTKPSNFIFKRKKTKFISKDFNSCVFQILLHIIFLLVIIEFFLVFLIRKNVILFCFTYLQKIHHTMPVFYFRNETLKSFFPVPAFDIAFCAPWIRSSVNLSPVIDWHLQIKHFKFNISYMYMCLLKVKIKGYMV